MYKYNSNNFLFINLFRRRSYPLKSDSDRPIRFAVRSLGWVEIAEDDLTPERSSKAVNKCIVDLSLGRNDLLDVVGRWGDVCELLALLIDIYESIFIFKLFTFCIGKRFIYGFR